MEYPVTLRKVFSSIDPSSLCPVRLIEITSLPQKQILKENIKMEFLTVYCFVFLLKMKP